MLWVVGLGGLFVVLLERWNALVCGVCSVARLESPTIDRVWCPPHASRIAGLRSTFGLLLAEFLI